MIVRILTQKAQRWTQRTQIFYKSISIAPYIKNLAISAYSALKKNPVPPNHMACFNAKGAKATLRTQRLCKAVS